jgi:predicted choloylglycine hydrolase
MSYEELLLLEGNKQSIYSPSVVLCDEIIARVLFSPKHYLDGEVLPSAFQQIFDSKGGMSILRLNYSFQESLSKTIEQLEKDGVKYTGYTCAKVKDIRAILTEKGYRVFYVLDTATKDKLGHADIFLIRLSFEESGLTKKAFKNYIRFEISQVFNELIVKEEA